MKAARPDAARPCGVNARQPLVALTHCRANLRTRSALCLQQTCEHTLSAIRMIFCATVIPLFAHFPRRRGM
jgi:hypothetical protein